MTEGARRPKARGEERLVSLDDHLHPDPPPLLANEQIRERDGNQCAKCGSTRDLDVHHRLLRSGGTDERASNRVTLCRKCHSWAHSHVRAATLAGWLVSRYADPAKIPVDHHLWPAGPVLLLEDGGIQIWQEEDDGA